MPEPVPIRLFHEIMAAMTEQRTTVNTSPGAVERNGINPVPETERHGSPASLF
jgi:hypothetical protein